MEKYILSPEEIEALSIAREQVKNGQYLSQKEVDEKIEKLFSQRI